MDAETSDATLTILYNQKWVMKALERMAEKAGLPIEALAMRERIEATEDVIKQIEKDRWRTDYGL